MDQAGRAMELRRRSARFGSAAYADACDACENHRLVRVGRSHVCDGVGVFATRAVPAGTVMTAYPFVRRGWRRSRRKTRASLSDTSDYEYEWNRDGSTLDGNPALLAALPKRRRPAGCAHLANDAIHREVTGRDNNCDFVEDRSDPKKRPRLHLVTTRAIRRGEELLVSYALAYWVGRESVQSRDSDLRRWLACHRRVREALPHLDLWDYIGAFGDANTDTGTGEHLAYMATCSGATRRVGGGCEACLAKRACPLRRVEVRWSSTTRGGTKMVVHSG